MSEGAKAPVQVQAIPDFQVNAGSAIEQVDFTQYIQNPEDQPGDLSFTASLLGGEPLPEGLVLSDAGLFAGTPSAGTAAALPYHIIVVADNGEEQLQVPVKLTILQTLTGEESEPIFDLDVEDEETLESDGLDEAELEGEADEALEDIDLEGLLDEVSAQSLDQGHLNDQKRQAWEAIINELELPNAQDLMNRGITYDDVYYLLSRFANFVIWNADDMSAPGELTALNIEGASDKFNVYDRGCCLVAAPVSLYDYSRGLIEGVATARAMAKEAFNRGWHIEFGGFDKMVSAAWVEMRMLTEEHNKELEIRHYQPTYHDYQLYSHVRGITL